MFGLGSKRVPAQLRPPLELDERVLAWAHSPAPVPDSDAVVATNLGLWLPGTSGPERLGWHEINKATWSMPRLTVIPAGVVEETDEYTVVEDLPARVCALDDPGKLPHQIRTRVTRSVAYTKHHPLPGGGGVRVVSRRVPGVDGVRWTVRYDAGTAHDTAEIRELTGELVAQAQASGADLE